MVQKKRKTLYQDPVSSASLAQDTPLMPPTSRDVEQAVKKDLVTESHDLYQKQPVDSTSQRTSSQPQKGIQPKQTKVATHPAADVSNLSDEDLTQNEKIKQENKKHASESKSLDSDTPTQNGTQESKKSDDTSNQKSQTPTSETHQQAKAQSRKNNPINPSTENKLIKQAVNTQMQQPLIAPLDKKTKDEAKKAAAKDALKESLKDLQTSQEKLKNLMNKNERILCQISTVFPFTLFPTKVIVRENKVEVIIGEFFASNTIRAADIKDISEIVVNTSLFFASMKIVARNFVDNEILIKFLKNEDALQVRRLVEGLTSMAEEKIDVSKLSTEHLVDRAEKLGSSEATAM